MRGPKDREEVVRAAISGYKGTGLPLQPQSRGLLSKPTGSFGILT